jgi:predicted metal-dependent HD superfamily phosphohydrolase
MERDSGDRPVGQHEVLDEVADLLRHVPVTEQAKRKLIDDMRSANRVYHVLGHLAALWRRHRLFGAAEGLATPKIEMLLASAIAYHDSVYHWGDRDNEELSAQYWLRSSAEAGLAGSDRLWVADTIRATRDHLAYHPEGASSSGPGSWSAASPGERARLWMLDLDLASLGDPPDLYDRNTAQLRAEAAHLSDAEWNAGQAAFLGQLLASPFIFRSPTWSRLCEASARRNIARQLGLGN